MRKFETNAQIRFEAREELRLGEEGG